MKRTWVILLGAAFLCAVVTMTSAQQTDKSTPALYKTCSGRIESVTPGDAAKGKGPEIVVVDKVNHKVTLVVKATTKIVDAKGAASTPDKFQKGQDVIIKYQTIAGVNEAVSIKITK